MSQYVIIWGLDSPLYIGKNPRLPRQHMFLGVIGSCDFVPMLRIIGFRLSYPYTIKPSYTIGSQGYARSKKHNGIPSTSLALCINFISYYFLMCTGVLATYCQWKLPIMGVMEAWWCSKIRQLLSHAFTMERCLAFQQHWKKCYSH